MTHVFDSFLELLTVRELFEFFLNDGGYEGVKVLFVGDTPHLRYAVILHSDRHSRYGRFFQSVERVVDMEVTVCKLCPRRRFTGGAPTGAVPLYVVDQLQVIGSLFVGSPLSPCFPEELLVARRYMLYGEGVVLREVLGVEYFFELFVGDSFLLFGITVFSPL